METKDMTISMRERERERESTVTLATKNHSPIPIKAAHPSFTVGSRQVPTPAQRCNHGNEAVTAIEANSNS